MRDVELKRQRDRERQARLTASGIPRRPVSEQAKVNAKARSQRRDQWRVVGRAFAKVMAAGGVDVIARADARDVEWRDAA